MNGITFNGFHSFRDKGVTLASRTIGNPSKEKKKYKPPYSNKELDFSRLYGGETFTTRILTYSFNLIENSKVNLNFKFTELINWLMNSNGKQPLYDDAIPGYYFLAEVEDEAAIVENASDGVLTVKFAAHSFKIKVAPEGSPYWDDYSVLDRYQETTFDVNGTKNISIYNDGIPDSIPIITASSPMIIRMHGSTFEVPSGKYESYGLFFAPGENELLVTGNGKIEFSFHKELV